MARYECSQCFPGEAWRLSGVVTPSRTACPGRAERDPVHDGDRSYCGSSCERVSSTPSWAPRASQDHLAALGRGRSLATVTSVDPQSGTPRVLLARVDDCARIDTLPRASTGRSSERVSCSGPTRTAQSTPRRSTRSAADYRWSYATPCRRAHRTGNGAGLSISETGAVVYALASAVNARSRIEIANRRTGARIVLPSPPGVRVFPDLHLSPDGRRLAVAGTRGVSNEIWLYQVANAEVEAFTVEGISSWAE